MGAPLEMFLRAITSGNTTFSDEMYKHFGGDDILTQLQKYDPDAKWVDSDVGGGEGGSSVAGKRLDFDVSKLPKSKMGTAGLDLRPEKFTEGGLYRPSMVDEDEAYGRVTNSKNVKPAGNTLETLTPYLAMLISAGGPMAGAALSGAGLGLGLGGTSAVTGGLFGAAPFAPGAGAASAWTKLLPKLPSLGRGVSNGGMDWTSLLGPALGAAGVPGGSQLAMLMRLMGR